MTHSDNSKILVFCKNHFFFFLPATIFIALTLIITLQSNAQDNQNHAEQKSKVLLSEQEWKAVEGIFQSSQNKDMYVQFSAKGDILLAKLLWNNNEIHLLPESAFAFISKEAGDEGPIHITFSKDSTGTVNQVNVANNGVWNRTKDYKPVVKKEMEHSTDQLKPYEGLYQLQNESSRFIQFSVKGNNLVLKQHWDGNEISFVPESTTEFFSKEIPQFTLSFSKDSKGDITQVTAFRRDVWIKTKRPSFTLVQLKSFEGKYQSKDDPDNLIELIAMKDHLVVKQLWDQKEIPVEPMTENYFYNESKSYPVSIIKDKDGVVNQVLILGMQLFSKIK